jgi:hypothetical protein
MGEREDAVRRSARPDDYHRESSGARSLIRAEDRPQACGIKEAKPAEVEDDPPSRGRLEDAVEYVFDAADRREVELANQAQAHGATRLLDGDAQVRLKSGHGYHPAIRPTTPQGGKKSMRPQQKSRPTSQNSSAAQSTG